ncbi:MAG: TRAP transporter large permease [Betaproteobacteria bacterium]|nr:MAG: TRAP transporter large permease [Betaproteobacteria bacterium]
MSGLLFGVFILLMCAAVPLAVALGLGAVAAIVAAKMGIMSVPTTVYSGIAKYPLIAIPVFILAGMIFERSGVAARLVRLAEAIVGKRAGGLAAAAVLVCMVLGGISGSGPADAAAVGAIMIPAMTRAGYPKAFSATLIAAGGSTAIVIPPSIALIIYSVLVPQASVQALFAAGLIPGILTGATLIGASMAFARIHGWGRADEEATPPFWQSLREAGWGLLAPVIILGGMRSGLFTPTEAAVVAVAYGLIVALGVYRSMTWRAVWDLLAESAEVSAVILFIVGLAALFGWAVDTIGVFNEFAKWLTGTGTSEVWLLLAITAMLLVAGTALDAIATYFIFLPFLVPVAMAYGWNLVWLGIIITINVAIGQFTPPTAVNLMVTCRLAGIPMESTLGWCLWLVGAMTAMLLVLTFVPAIVLFLPRWLGYL